MCLNFDHEVEKDGSFDGVPPAGMSFADYNSLINPEAVSGNSEQKTVY